VRLARDGTDEQKVQAAGALGNLAIGSLANGDVVRKSGGIPVLVGLARDGTDEQKAKAARALGSLDYGNPVNVDAVHESDGISVLMRLARDGTDEQKVAAADLSNKLLWIVRPHRPRDLVRESVEIPVLVRLALWAASSPWSLVAEAITTDVQLARQEAAAQPARQEAVSVLCACAGGHACAKA
jgi:hypothetical protein